MEQKDGVDCEAAKMLRRQADERIKTKTAILNLSTGKINGEFALIYVNTWEAQTAMRKPTSIRGAVNLESEVSHSLPKWSVTPAEEHH